VRAVHDFLKPPRAPAVESLNIHCRAAARSPREFPSQVHGGEQRAGEFWNKKRVLPTTPKLAPDVRQKKEGRRVPKERAALMSLSKAYSLQPTA
jgi:hypothetical protein